MRNDDANGKCAGSKKATIFVVLKLVHRHMGNLADCNYRNLDVLRHILTFGLDRIGMPWESVGGLSVRHDQCMSYTGHKIGKTWIKLWV